MNKEIDKEKNTIDLLLDSITDVETEKTDVDQILEQEKQEEQKSKELDVMVKEVSILTEITEKNSKDIAQIVGRNANIPTDKIKYSKIIEDLESIKLIKELDKGEEFKLKEAKQILIELDRRLISNAEKLVTLEIKNAELLTEKREIFSCIMKDIVKEKIQIETGMTIEISKMFDAVEKYQKSYLKNKENKSQFLKKIVELEGKFKVDLRPSSLQETVYMEDNKIKKAIPGSFIKKSVEYCRQLTIFKKKIEERL